MKKIITSIFVMTLLISSTLSLAINTTNDENKNLNDPYIGNCNKLRSEDLGKIKVRGGGSYDSSYVSVTCFDIDEIIVPCGGETILFKIDYDIDGTKLWDWVRACGTVNGVERCDDSDGGAIGTFQWELFCEPGMQINYKCYGYVTDIGWNRYDSCEESTIIVVPQCNLKLNSESHTFNARVGGSDLYEFTLVNNGEHGSGSIRITGSGSEHFYHSVSSFNIDCGESIKIPIEYRPKDQDNTHYATLTVNGDSFCNDVSASLKGNPDDSIIKIIRPVRYAINIGIFDFPPMTILENLGLTLWLGSQLIVEANTMKGIFDEVKFKLEGIDDVYEGTSNDGPPFSLIFSNLEKGVYTLTASGYNNNIPVNADKMEGILYIPY